MAYDAAARLEGAVSPDYRDVAQFVGRASLAALMSDVRLWWRRTGALAESAFEIGRALQATIANSERRAAGQGTLLDAVRAFFRRVAELPADESRRLQAALDKIAEQVWPAQPGRPHRRRWNAKR